MYEYKVVQIDFLPAIAKSKTIEEGLNAAVKDVDGEIVETQYINPQELRAGLFIITIKKGAKRMKE